MDYDEILRTTHTMKGIASNLEFTHLQQKSAKAVDMIHDRKGQTVYCSDGPSDPGSDDRSSACDRRYLR